MFELYPLGKGKADPTQFTAFRNQFKLRRADHFSIMMAQAAFQAAEDAFGSTHLPEETAIITASSFGPQQVTALYLNDLLDYPEEEMIPTRFTHSVYNAAASYLASLLGAKGPAYTLTGFHDLFYEALFEARLLLQNGLCRQVILAAGEEHSLETPYFNQITPIPPENAYAFIFSSEPGKYIPIREIESFRNKASLNKAEELFLKLQ